MEQRRQRGIGGPQPLGNRKNRTMAAKGIGEDLGSTDYGKRPKMAQNPRAKSTKGGEEERKGRKSTGSPVDVDPDESSDPIDFLSSQEPETSSSSNAKSGPITSLKPTPQPAPFGRSRSTQPASKSSSTSNVVSKAVSTSHRTGKARRKLNSGREDATSMPPSAHENDGVKSPVRGPQPAPFKKRTQPRETVTEQDKSSTLAPKLPAPPPWKIGSTSQAGLRLNNTEGLSDHSDISASQRVGESHINRESLKSMRIPKKNSKNSEATASAPTSEPRIAPKKTAAFPMAGYAKQVAAKQLDDNISPRSPRKRFKPDDVERIIQQAEADELMGIDDETQRKFTS
ncbi:unnamed protein product [Rhizoctonia solani]|uniref:Uncharacterized protein n=1 Tax=Rhizoctonia solani TaxID=456999 RepID=A0A8H3H6F8_9AGAM|nr:unnamed protein product [Rhizoctonia solani]